MEGQETSLTQIFNEINFQQMFVKLMLAYGQIVTALNVNRVGWAGIYRGDLFVL